MLGLDVEVVLTLVLVLGHVGGGDPTASLSASLGQNRFRQAARVVCRPATEPVPPPRLARRETARNERGIGMRARWAGRWSNGLPTSHSALILVAQLPPATMSLDESLDELCQEARGRAPASIVPLILPGCMGSLSGFVSVPHISNPPNTPIPSCFIPHILVSFLQSSSVPRLASSWATTTAPRQGVAATRAWQRRGSRS